MERVDIEIRTPEIRLDGLLKFAAVVGTGGEAKFLIQEGRVRVNGQAERHRSHRIRPGDRVVLHDEDDVAAIEIRVQAGTQE